MKKIFLLIIIALLAIIPAFSSTQDDLFNKANAFYQKGDYVSAIADYRKIIESGEESSSVYFNLGNAYYKLNKTADAILSFERARLLAPDDEDIEFNLKIANLRTIDRFQSIPSPFFVQWYNSLRSLYSSSTWATIAVVMLWLAALSFIAFMVLWSVNLRKITFAVGIIALAIGIFSLVSAHQKWGIESARDTAIVYQPSVYVKSSPEEKSTDLFILHEGTKVKVLDSVSGWLKIRLANGNLGWLREKTVQII